MNKHKRKIKRNKIKKNKRKRFFNNCICPGERISKMGNIPGCSFLNMQYYEEWTWTDCDYFGSRSYCWVRHKKNGWPSKYRTEEEEIIRYRKEESKLKKEKENDK